MQEMIRPVDILIVDDEQSNLDILVEIISVLDEFKWKIARSGPECLSILENYFPDIIILDIMMPELDGYEVCRRIKNDPHQRFAKIIMVTARAMEEERLAGYEAGADDYIVKPFSEKELVAKIKVFTNLAKNAELEELQIKQRATKEALDESEKRYKSLFEESQSIMLLFEPKTTKIIDANQAACDFYGYSKDEFKSLHTTDLNMLSKKALFEKIRDVIDNKNRHFLFQHKLADGEIRDVEVYSSPIIWEGNSYLFSIIHDITERTKTEKETKEILTKAMLQDKLASIGQTATGIAHEINQPLSYIQIVFQATIRDILANKCDLNELKSDCKESLRQIERITKIINHLRVFGRDVSMNSYDVHLKNVLDNALIILADPIRLKNIALHIKIDPDLPTIHGDPTKLEQIFINLLQNSMDELAGRKDGTISLTINAEKDTVKIRLKDNGSGIPAQKVGKIFEPFYTTKEIGKGTGLGLSIVYGIVQEHAGSIVAEESSEGACFVITLPNTQEDY